MATLDEVLVPRPDQYRPTMRFTPTTPLSEALSAPERETIQPYKPSWRDEAAAFAINRLGVDPVLIRNLFGSRGAGTSGMGLIDFTPLGVPLWLNEGERAAEEGDFGTAALELGTALPVPGLKPVSKALQKALKHPTWRRAPKASDIARTSTELPNLRNLPVEEAVRVAEKQPHLIPGNAATEGAYIGGPRDIKSYGDLRKLRERVWDFIASEPRGADWYDRYRSFLTEITGGKPLDTKTQAEIEALMSAGVDPSSEFGFALTQLNARIAGFRDTKAARPMQQKTVNEAADRAASATTASEMAEATKMARGAKTGEYATKINPYPPMSDEQLVAQSLSPMIGHNQGPPMFDPIPERVPGSTGVNDFRQAGLYEYRDASGNLVKQFKGTPHQWLDYENTLMVDVANKIALAGRRDWTGEQIQAMPWVKQKAEALMSRRPGLTYEAAIEEAMKTIADFAPKHTLSATHEPRPGVDLGYLPDLDTASPAEIERFSLDPLRQWNTAPGRRDAIYAGTGVPNVTGAQTGFNMRVRPSVPMRGIYEGPSGLETNAGQVARPLVGLKSSGGKKTMQDADRAIAKAAETLRGLVDVQRASAAHIPFLGGKVKDSGAWVVPLNRALTDQEAINLKNIVKKYGYDDVVDRGEGVTIESFYSGAPVLKGKQMDAFLTDVRSVLPGSQPVRAYTDSVYVDLADNFLKGEGSGAVSQQFLDTLVTPELREAFDANPELAQVMANKIAADRGLRHGRKDIEVMRRIVGSGRGWVARLEDAIKKGLVPSVLAAGLYAKMLAGPQEEAQPNDGS